jgi:hypothetical protein
MNQSSVVGGRPQPPPRVSGGEGEPPLKDVLVELWQNMERLVRQELALAGAELDSKAQRLATELRAVAVGAALLVAGGLALVATVILLLALVMPAWTASLITGAVAAGVGFGLIQAKKPSPRELVPERTIRSVQKDLNTFREPMK